jgi:hypothetical protein
MTSAEVKTHFARHDAMEIVSAVCRFSYAEEVRPNALAKAISVLRV